MELFYFYAFTTILLSSAFMVIRVENAVHAVLYLVLVFCSNSAILLLLGAEFIALLLLVIYIGAITILFLFVVMMLSLKQKKQNTTLQDMPIGFFIGFIFFLVMFFVLNQEIPTNQAPNPNLLTAHTYKSIVSDGKTRYFGFDQQYPSTLNEMEPLFNVKKDIQTFGLLLYETYFFNVLIAGIILLVALLGAVTLAGQQRKKQQRRQQIYQQLSRRIQNSVLRVK